MRVVDLTGRRFGKLVVLERAGSAADGHAAWRCRCDCGNETVVTGAHLRKGETTSCGCWKRELSSTHGMSRGRLYHIWVGMKKRILNKNATIFKHYGGRGISICDEWRNDFCAFRDWALTNGYAESLSIDRIDNSKGYSASNCRWVTRKLQSNNRRSNRLVSFMGEAYTIAEWAEILGIGRDTLRYRLQTLPPEEAFFLPVRVCSRKSKTA